MGQSVTAIAYGVKMDEKLRKRVNSHLCNKWGDWHGFKDEGIHGGPNAHDARRNEKLRRRLDIVEAGGTWAEAKALERAEASHG